MNIAVLRHVIEYETAGVGCHRSIESKMKSSLIEFLDSSYTSCTKKDCYLDNGLPLRSLTIFTLCRLRGGELFDYISKKDFLTEEEAIDFTRQILQGLQHLHSLSVVHLDLKVGFVLQSIKIKQICVVFEVDLFQLRGKNCPRCQFTLTARLNVVTLTTL